MAKNEFIKIGEQIIAKPKGADYDLIPGKVICSILLKRPCPSTAAAS